MVSFTHFALLAIAQFTLARPSVPSPFQVTDLNTFQPTGRPGQVNIYRVGFNVTDPEDSSKTFCETRWEYNDASTGYPTEYLANCTSPSYSFKFVDYSTIYNFVLDVKHEITNGGTGVTRLAKGLVGFDIVQCQGSASGFVVCNQKEGVEFPLTVYDGM